MILSRAKRRLCSQNRSGSSIIEMVIVVVMITIIANGILAIFIGLLGSTRDANNRLAQIEASLATGGAVASLLSQQQPTEVGVRVAASTPVPGLFGAGNISANQLVPSTIGGDQIVARTIGGCQRFMYIERLQQIWLVSLNGDTNCSGMLNVAGPSPFQNGSLMSGLIRGPNQNVGGAGITRLVSTDANYATLRDGVLDSITTTTLNGLIAGPTPVTATNQFRFRLLASGVERYQGLPVFRFFEENGAEIGIDTSDQKALLTSTPPVLGGVFNLYNVPGNVPGNGSFAERLDYINLTFTVAATLESATSAKKVVSQDIFVGQNCSLVL